MSEFDTVNLEQLKNIETNNFSNNVATNPFLLEDKKPIFENNLAVNFDSSYEQALQLLGGDKLLRPAATNAIVRKTSSQGVYKVLIKTSNGSQVKILDESQLFRNKKYAAGSISKLSDDEYEIVSFDEEDNMEINHFDKLGAIEFINQNKLTL